MGRGSRLPMVNTEAAYNALDRLVLLQVESGFRMGGAGLEDISEWMKCTDIAILTAEALPIMSEDRARIQLWLQSYCTLGFGVTTGGRYSGEIYLKMKNHFLILQGRLYHLDLQRFAFLFGKDFV